MTTDDTLHRPLLSRQAVFGALSALTLLGLAACAPRQAIIQSEPNPGAGAASVGVEVLRSDLRELAAAQERFAADRGYYASRQAELNFTPSSGGRVDIIQGDRSGWSAVASSGSDECGIFQGDVRSPRGYLVQPDRVECR